MYHESVMEPNQNLDFKAIVQKGGGDWAGIQEGFPDQPALLLFNSPATGSTLAIAIPTGWEYDALVRAVQTRIKESDATFADRRISVKAPILSDISNRLMRLVEEVDALYLKDKS